MTCNFIIFFFFNDTATTEIYTLSLHDALPISFLMRFSPAERPWLLSHYRQAVAVVGWSQGRSEEHTSELQSQSNLVCRLLLEKKKKIRLRHIVSRHNKTIRSGTHPVNTCHDLS